MESFFSLFPTADKRAWQTQVRKELKDTGTYEQLRWHTDEHFSLEPYYTADDLSHLPVAAIQGAQKQMPGWLNAPQQRITNEKADNLTLREALARGADALVIELTHQPDLAQLLAGIKLSETPVLFHISGSQTGSELDLIRKLKNMAPYQLKGGILADTSGATAEVTRLTADSPQFRTICASSHAFHNAGATVSQELAFMLAMLADAYDTLTDDGLSVDQLVPKTMLSVSIGTSYFMEIAKLRALRLLFYRFLDAYEAAGQYTSPFIHAQTSFFYSSSATPYTNLIRGTTEAMAAVIGGCDALTVQPYNTVSGDADEFAARIARNVSVLLKEESYLDRVADPSAGSYYIENLTHQLAESAWALFLEVEKKGGFTRALANGYIQSEIEQAYRTKVEAVKNSRVLVGVTTYRSDEATDESTPNVPSKNQPGVLPRRRLAEDFE